jgi:cytochrome c oxidase subunit IV
MTMGAAFGLFAVFSILRIRTEGINTKDMTYLFMAISIGLITAVSNGSIWELVFINLAIIILVVLIDGAILMKKEVAQLVEYDRLELINPKRRPELFADIESRTGLKIHRIESVSIDFLKESATFQIYYYL